MLVMLDNRNDGGRFGCENDECRFPVGTHLVELTGNAAAYNATSPAQPLDQVDHGAERGRAVESERAVFEQQRAGQGLSRLRAADAAIGGRADGHEFEQFAGGRDAEPRTMWWRTRRRGSRRCRS